MGYNVVITLPMAQQVIREITQPPSNKVTPYQIYLAFKVMTANTGSYFQHFAPLPLYSVTSNNPNAMDV